MKNILAALAMLIAFTGNTQSLSRYIIQFKNKATTPYSFNNPSAYLSQRAIDRRTRYGIAIDSADLPVTPRYLDSIRLAGSVTILNVSRWLNQVSIQTSDAAALAKMATFSFVEKATPIAARIAGGKRGTQAVTGKRKTVKKKIFQPTADFYQYGASSEQVAIHNGQFLHNIGLRGQGMIISLLDAGFLRYTTLRAFDSVNANGQVLGTHDFVAREQSVVEDDAHGMQCFSMIAANIPSQFVGTAPKAFFYLFRTEESATEFPIEEHNWVCGAERADSSGGDVISSSLGYSNGMTDAQFNHTYADMNGNTTIAARGADMAARKGLLVLNSAGNQGNDGFRYIATPADGDSVVAVGAVTKSGETVAFSSYGPSSDGQVKPDIASVGVAAVVQTSGNNIGTNNGTSFACPNIAGLVTCLWQGFPEVNNMRIVSALRLSGSKAAAPDNRVGYGIPDMKKAVLLLLKEVAVTTVTTSANLNTLEWTSKDIAGMKYEIERKAPGDATYAKIGEVAARGATFSTQRYQFVDSLRQMQTGILSYRLRQVIDTASGAAFSADYIDTVNVTTVTTNEAFTVVPNPAYHTISFQMATAEAFPVLHFSIIDSKGAVVTTRTESKGPGPVSFTFGIQNLAKGVYHLLVYDQGNRLASKKFIKL